MLFLLENLLDVLKINGMMMLMMSNEYADDAHDVCEDDAKHRMRLLLMLYAAMLSMSMMMQCGMHLSCRARGGRP